MKLVKMPKTKFITIGSQLVDLECPFCRETKIYDSSSSNNGIECHEIVWFRSFPRITRLKQKEFYCHTCEAKWKNNIIKERIKL